MKEIINVLEYGSSPSGSPDSYREGGAYYIIIVAGGTGTRMNAGMPKQFISLAGKPILMHTIEKFFAADQSMKIIVVLPENQIGEWKRLCTQHNFIIAHERIKVG